MDNTVELLERLWDFEPADRVHILIALARSKENENINATAQPTMRKIVEERHELEDKIEQLETATSRFDENYRLYAVINGRNAWDGYYALQQKMLSEQEKSRKSGEQPYILKRIDHEWKSILHKPRCRDQSRFLWDIDDTSPDAFDRIYGTLDQHTDIVVSQVTPNGFHIITEPFNYTEVGAYDEEHDTFHGVECERESDDMMFLGFLGSDQ